MLKFKPAALCLASLGGVFAPFTAFAGPLRERFGEFPSPIVSATQKTLGVVETVGGATAFIVGTKISQNNSYRVFVSAYEDYQKAARNYENAGGSRVSPAAGESGVAVLMEEPVELEAARQAQPRRAKAKSPQTSTANARSNVAVGGGAAALASEAPQNVAARALYGAQDTINKGMEKLGQLTSRLNEAAADRARHSEVLSRVYDLGVEGQDDLTKSALSLDRARLRLKAAAERVLAQEGISAKQAFVPLKELSRTDRYVLAAESIQEANEMSKKFSTRSMLAKLGSLLLVADGVYRIYLVEGHRDPGLFPVGWSAVDAGSNLFRD